MDGVAGRREGQRRRPDLITRLNTEDHQGEMERRGSGGERRRVAHANILCHLTLEGVDVRAEGDDPARVEGIEEELALAGPHVGCGEEDLLVRHRNVTFIVIAASPYTIHRLGIHWPSPPLAPSWFVPKA